jgi:hypothetical protein
MYETENTLETFFLFFVSCGLIVYNFLTLFNRIKNQFFAALNFSR